MRKIKINFCDFYDSFDKNDNFIINTLRKKYEVEISDNPDYLFCSSFRYDHIKYSCVKIFYTGENICPDFNLYDYAMGFNYIDFEDRYLRYPIYALYDVACKKAIAKHTRDDSFYLGKKGFCNFVISNSLSDGARDKMIDALNAYKPVDGGGKYRNTVGGPVKDKIEFEENYKFTICFENSSSNGYTTEKIMEAFAGGTIPIYYGSPDIAKEFNDKSFINCHDYKDINDIVDAVKKIDSDDSLYLSMVKAPIFNDETDGQKYLDEAYVSDFLENIFSQEYEKAFRRNRVYIGARYERRIKSYYFMDKLLYYPRRITYFLHNKMRIAKKGK